MKRRCLKPMCGLLVLGAMIGVAACGKREPQEVSPAAPPPTPAFRLTDAAYKVEWLSNDVPGTMEVGKPVLVKVDIRNLSGEAWPGALSAVPTQPGAYAVRLGYRWLGPGAGEVASYSGTRGDLSGPVAPGAKGSITISVFPPQRPGKYSLQLDLVHEFVAWFDSKGATKLIVPVTVN